MRLPALCPMRHAGAPALTLALALGLLAHGAAPLAAQDQPAPAEAWSVTALQGEAVEAGAGVTLEFQDGRISGRAGCNRYAGEVTLAAATPATGAFAIGPVGVTRMACLSPAAEIETAFLNALGRVDSYRIEADGTLSLLAGDDGLIRAEPAVR